MNKSILLNIPIINLNFLRSSFVNKIMNHILMFFSINLNFILMIFINHHINVFPENWRSSDFCFSSLDSVFDSGSNNGKIRVVIWLQIFSMISLRIIFSNESSIIVSFSKVRIINHRLAESKIINNSLNNIFINAFILHI